MCNFYLEVGFNLYWLGMASSTTTTTQEPGTVELTFVSAPRPDNKRVKVSTGSTTPEEIYNAWFESVYA